MTMVGAEILLVPDGLSEDGKLLHIALQVTPSLRSTEVVELEKWPSKIAELARNMMLLVGRNDGDMVYEVGRIACASALKAYHFTENMDGTYIPNHCLSMADQLWQKVFNVDETLGFDQLFEALKLLHDDGSGYMANAKILPSRIADLHLFWQVLGVSNPNRKQLQAVTNKLELWRKISVYIEQGPSEVQRNYLDSKMKDRLKLGCELAIEEERRRSLRQSLEALVYPDSSLKMDVHTTIKKESEAAEMFHDYMLGLQRPTRHRDSANTLDQSIPEVPTEDDWQAKPEEIAGRKLSTLLSLPSLATYLSLGVEIAVESDTLFELADQFRDNLVLSVVFCTPNGTPLLDDERRAWSACCLSTDNASFTPRAQGTRRNAIPLTCGLVKLDSARFSLETVDVENMTADRFHAVRYGDPSTFNDVDKVMRIAGFTVCDSLSSAALEEEMAWDQKLLSQAGDIINWAEDLLRGFRPDFALSHALAGEPLSPNKLIWRSISGRKINCEDEEFDQNFFQLAPIRRMLHRDHGMTQVPKEIIPGIQLQVQRIDQMFVWQGENIAIPRNLDEPDDDIQAQPHTVLKRLKREGLVSDPAKDLGLRICYSLPKEKALKMMPMREGRAYAVAMRAVFANGISLPFEKAVSRYSSISDFGELVLGEENSDGKARAVRLPAEDAGPPGVHLHWQDSLVKVNDLREEAPGESLLTIVVRDGIISTDFGKVGRFITPPRVSFDLAEKQGQFDAVIERVPTGAFSGKNGLWRYGPDGAFPEARFGRLGGAVRYLKDEQYLQFVPGLGYRTKHRNVHLTDEVTFGPNKNQSRGTVAVIGPQPSQIGGPPGQFYPHKHARILEANMRSLTYKDKWEDNTGIFSELDIGESPCYRAFWGGSVSSDALPLFLEVKPASIGATFLNTKQLRIKTIEGKLTQLPTVTVNLGKGEVWQLVLTAVNKIVDKHQRGNYSVENNDEEPKRGKPVFLRLVHAVSKPLADVIVKGVIDLTSGRVKIAESLSRSSSTNFRLGLNAVTVSVSEQNNPERTSDAAPTWEEHVRNYAASGKDMLDWDSQEGGDTTFIVGRLALDRKSSGDLRVEAEWDNYNSDTVTFQNGKWIKNPARLNATLMALEIERNGHHAGLDLLQQGPFFAGTMQPETLLRGQTYAVPNDGQLAREYKVIVVIGSAFKDYYEDGKTETRVSEMFRVKKKCTFRPPPPRLAEIESRLYWSEIDEPGVIGRRRSTRLRIRLGEKWFVSGEGEKLGIVLRKPKSTLGSNSRFGPYLSVTGADPTMLTAQVTEFLSEDNFTAFDGQSLYRDVELFLPEIDESVSMRDVKPARIMVEGDDKLTVDVLALTPKFSETEGLYCDIEIRLDVNMRFNPYNAFVHFGFVRFQENAVKQLRASFPLKDPKTKLYLLPERELRVKEGIRRQRSLEFTGSGYKLVNNSNDGPRRDLPVLKATLMDWDKQRERWVADKNIVDQEMPTHMKNIEFLWKKDFEIKSGTPQVLLVEEFERIPIDNSDIDECDDEQLAMRLVYSCMLKL